MFLMKRIISQFNRSWIHAHIQRCLGSIELSNYYFHQISNFCCINVQFNGIPQCNRSWMQYKLEGHSCVFIRIPASIASSFYCTEELHWNSFAVTGSPRVLSAIEFHRPSGPIMTRSAVVRLGPRLKFYYGFLWRPFHVSRIRADDGKRTVLSYGSPCPRNKEIKLVLRVFRQYQNLKHIH